MIKYKYALDDGQPVYIKDLTGGSDRKDYICPGCGNILRPVLGVVREKHFRHKTEGACFLETYLHSLGKSLFKREYENALVEGTAFDLKYKTPVICNYCKHGSCEVEKTIKSYDLTTQFKTISLEKADGGFIPDILLETDTGEKMYIEIAVSHYSSSKKQKSGTRIIEFTIQNEEDLELLRKPVISEEFDQVTYYNFHPRPVDGIFKQLCAKRYAFFTVYPSGKCRINHGPLYEVENFEQKAKDWYIKRLPMTSEKGLLQSFVLEVENAFYDGVKIKNCWLCRYHGVNEDRGGWGLMDEILNRIENRPNHSIFCKFLKKTCGSNEASNCQYYRADPKVFHYRTPKNN